MHAPQPGAASRVPSAETLSLAALLELRPSISVQQVADTVCGSTSTVEQLIEEGELEGHYWGRVRRIYVDSLRAYQERYPLSAKQAEKKKPPSVRNEQAAAEAELRALGVDI